MEDFIKKIKALEPTERMIGLDNVPYAFGWVDAINSVEKLVKESDSLPIVSFSLFNEALRLMRDLAEHQNGAPVIRDEDEYNKTMAEVWDFLEANET